MTQVMDSEKSREEKREDFEIRDSSISVSRRHAYVTFSSLPQDFTQKMVNAVTKGLSSLETGRASTMYYLEKNHGVRLTDAFTRPNHFLSGLHGILGEGAAFIERSIVEEISASFTLSPKPASLGLAVNAAARQYKASQKHAWDGVRNLVSRREVYQLFEPRA